MAISPLAVSGAAVATLAVLGLAVFACRRWRRGAPAAPSSPASPQDDDINRPLISDNLDDYSGPSNYLCSSIVGESGIRINRSNTSPRTHGLVNKGIIYPTESHLIEEIHLGSTLKRTAEASGPTTDVKHIRRDSREENHNGSLPVKDTTVGSHLALEVIAGPSHGINRYLQSGNTSMLRMTLGRVPPSDLVLNDSEVSGKHARIDWNANDNPWEKDINQGTLVVFNVDPSITNDDLHQIFGDYGEIGRFRILLKWVITKLCSGAGGGVRRLNGRVHGATGGGGRRSKGRRPLPCRSVVAENGQRVGDGSRYQFELPKLQVKCNKILLCTLIYRKIDNCRTFLLSLSLWIVFGAGALMIRFERATILFTLRFGTELRSKRVATACTLV